MRSLEANTQGGKGSLSVELVTMAINNYITGAVRPVWGATTAQMSLHSARETKQTKKEENTAGFERNAANMLCGEQTFS